MVCSSPSCLVHAQILLSFGAGEVIKWNEQMISGTWLVGELHRLNEIHRRFGEFWRCKCRLHEIMRLDLR